MQKSSVQIATRILLLGIITVTLQFSCYYFLGASFFTFGVTAILSFLLCHLFLESTLSYEACFSYSLLTVFLSSVLILFIYMQGAQGPLILTGSLLFFPVINWTLPLIYCILRDLNDRNSKYTHFNAFYRNMSILFLLFYTAFFIYLQFFRNDNLDFDKLKLNAFNYIPFLNLATLIEDYILGTTDFKTLYLFLLKDICLFIPYGFYIILVTRNLSRTLRGLLLLLFPLVLEILQLIFSPGHADVDHILLGLLGGFIGSLLFHLLNRIYYTFTERNFLQKPFRYSFYRNSLHF